MLRYLDAGESHGKALVAIIEGFPSNVAINVERINRQLYRRQRGYGRGNRMKIEKDKIDVISGIRGGKTTGSPICVMIQNIDYDNWKEVMDISKEYPEKVKIPRPGHADLNGALKYNIDDIRNVYERASARETAIRVAVGAISMELLREFNVKINSRTISIGDVRDESSVQLENDEHYAAIESSLVRCFDKIAEKKMIELINKASSLGETLGGCVEIKAFNIPCGLGSYVSYDRRMDFRIMGAIASIQGVKAVEIGDGIFASTQFGSHVNDEIIINNGMYKRNSNYAGGIEGGITNGMPINIRAFMKPIPTTKVEINTVDLMGNIKKSRYERSDVCAVPALGVICENVVAFEVAKAFLEKFSGDSIEDIKNSYDYYVGRIIRR
ncbi:chorismate synthase [Caloramator quimbayensis]|uniref:Chorismate synthase n=1 Tax=Caloramator quimbayensis TaxID=1147123 RepID=A0A1T4YFA1_9CLOT|nr:chorismate synthase [Caloramator quimbayensis]SKA99905.1 chorismate synthase [Caloramator quimbayensis]